MDKDQTLTSTAVHTDGNGRAATAPRHCRTITLLDEPVEIDSFFGPHQRIAEAVADLVQTTDAKGISIGIEGSWGSGKSTVATFLVTKLETDQNMAVVTFDAWAHEGDPLRRTFLQAIIRKLQELDWVEKQPWEDRIEELAHRREVVTTKDRLTITRSGWLIAFLLLLIPVGGAFVNAALRENITFDAGGPLALKFLILFAIGLLLTFTPVVVLLLRIKHDPDILGLLFNKGPTARTTETSRTANPTSIEFEDSFRDLFEEALENKRLSEKKKALEDQRLSRKKKKVPTNRTSREVLECKKGVDTSQRRVVLILDNLDRVDSKDALSIWSTLQTFLQHKGPKRPIWHERLWLLVLYDFRGLKQLWGSAENNSGDQTALSFIDKSFQIRFEVPALVPSDWSDFLTGQLKTAFPDHNESDWHEVYRVFAMGVSKSEGNKPPTIRELKLFVNQVGSIHRQWAAGDGRKEDTFPLGHIACYVLLRRQGDVINKLLNPGFPPKDYQDLLGSALRDNLAGLAFNVETDTAQQLLFTDKIKAALLQGSAEELKKIHSLLRAAFWSTFEQIVTIEWAISEATRMADAALALEESGLLQEPYQAAQSVKKAILEGALNAKTWPPLDRNKAKALAVLFKWKRELKDPVTQIEHFIDEVFKAIATSLIDHTTRTDLTLNARDWLGWLNVITEELESPLKQRALRVVFDTLSDVLRKSDRSVGQLEPVLEILSELQESPGFDQGSGKNLQDLADEGAIAAHLRGSTLASPNAVAWAIYVLARYSSDFQQSLLLRGDDDERKEEELNALFSDSMVETFVGILQRFKQTPLLFKVLKPVPEFRSLLEASLKIVLNDIAAKELFTGPDAVDRLEYVFAAVGDYSESTLRALLSEIQKQVNVVDELTSRTFQPTSANANLYLLLLKTADGDRERFVSWCIDGLRSIENGQLYLARSVLVLAFYLKGLGYEVELGERYSQALMNLIETSQHRPNLIFFVKRDDNLAALIGPIESRLRENFQDYLYNQIKNESDLPDWFFTLFGIELKTQLLHSSRAGKVVELFGVVVSRSDQSGLEWVQDTLAEARPSLEKYFNEPAWTDFKQAVRRALTTERFKVETSPLVKTIGTALNIKPRRNGLIAFASPDKARICVLDPKNLHTEILIEEPFSAETVVSDPSWSPDGNKLAFTASTPAERSEIFVFDSRSGETVPISGTGAGGSRPTWSPDGQKLAFMRGFYSDIFTVNLTTSEVQKLTTKDISESPNWSPDGTGLAFHRVQSDSMIVFVMNADGSNPTAITPGPKDFDPSWSPDARRIAFARSNATPAESGIYLINPDGSELLQLVQESDARAPTWSPDGTKLLFQVGLDSEARIYQVDADGQNKKELTQGTRPTWQAVLEDEPYELTESLSETSETVDSPS